MTDFKETLKQIKEVELTFKKGEIDIEEATAYTKGLLENAQQAEDAVIHFKDYKVPEGKGRNHIKTDITTLDDLTGGMGKGDLIVISGNTGDGKSTFSRFLIKKFSEQKKKSLVFSYEETNEEFLAKFRGELPDGYVPKVLTAKSPTWIEAKVLEAVELYGVEIVFIDNLKGLIDYESRRGDVSEVDFIIQSLKKIAIKYNVVIFLLAHIKKSDTALIDRNSLSGSKTIVDTASVAIALWRNREAQTKQEEELNGPRYTNFTTFYLIKNRYMGKYDNFVMQFDSTTGIYSPATKEEATWARNITKQYYEMQNKGGTK